GQVPLETPSEELIVNCSNVLKIDSAERAQIAKYLLSKTVYKNSGQKIEISADRLVKALGKISRQTFKSSDRKAHLQLLKADLARNLEPLLDKRKIILETFQDHLKKFSKSCNQEVDDTFDALTKYLRETGSLTLKRMVCLDTIRRDNLSKCSTSSQLLSK